MITDILLMAIVGLVRSEEALVPIPVGTYDRCDIKATPSYWPKTCPSTDCCSIANSDNFSRCIPWYTWNAGAGNYDDTTKVNIPVWHADGPVNIGDAAIPFIA